MSAPETRGSAPVSTTVSAVVSRRPGSNQAPTPSIENAREHLATARRVRAEYLVSVSEGLITPLDVIEQAATREGRALRKVSLRQLMLSVPGWGPSRVNRLLSVLGARISSTEHVGDKTIAWLIDPRSGGRRFLSYLDVNQTKVSPWPGFPFTNPQDGVR